MVSTISMKISDKSCDAHYGRASAGLAIEPWLCTCECFPEWLPISGCAQCEELAAAYQRATATRAGAEADYLAASFTRDPELIKLARQAVRSAVGKWRRASAALQKHQRSHVMTASAAY
jgi:hypothetical protein